MSGRKAEESIGEQFGRLVVLGIVGRNVRSQALVAAKCECGVVKEYQLDKLRRGKTASCGCGQRAATSKRQTTHGLEAVGLYAIYKGMMARCFNPDHNGYEDYGQRGITVEPWLQDPKNFKTYILYVLGPRPSMEWSLDRIDYNGGYRRNNLRWATGEMQRRNRRPRSDTRFLTFWGRRQNASEWSRELGMKPATLRFRLNHGWDIEKVFSAPVREQLGPITFQGRTQGLGAWSYELGMDQSTLWSRLNQRGWSVTKALTTPVRAHHRSPKRA